MKVGMAGVAWGIGVPVAACLWLWWLGTADVGGIAKLAGLGLAVAGTMAVFLVADRRENGSVLCAGVFSAGLAVCLGMTWMEVVAPAMEMGVRRFLGALVRLDVRSGLLVAGPVVGAVPVALVWFEQMGKWAGRLSNEKRKRSSSEVFGKAKLLDREHFRKLESGHGILLGQRGAGGKAPLVAWPLEGSAITFAPPRTGKGATIALNYLVPGFRGWPGSTVLVDPRGETWCVVARRRRQLGRRAVLLDPFGVVAGHAAKDAGDELHLPDVESVTYNPLDFIREDEELAAMDVNVLLDAFLTPPTGNNDASTHFYESARAIIAGYIAWVRFRCPAGRRNLQEVYRLLTLPPDERAKLMEEMRGSTAIAGSLSRIAAERQMQVGEQEAGSNFSTIANQLQFLNYPALVENTSRSSFDPMDLADGDMDLFVVVPETMTEHARAWLRLWVTIPNAVSDMKRLKREMLIVIDEMPKLGFLKPVMDGYNLAAGRGVHYWCFAQSISALDSTWGKENRVVLVDLAELVQLLGFPRTDVDGADALSAAIGTAGFETRSVSLSGQSSPGAVVDGGDRLNTGSNISVVAERLVTKDEILTMPADKQLIIAAPKDMPRDAFELNHARYWVRADCRGLSDANPLVVRKSSAREAEEDGIFASGPPAEPDWGDVARAAPEAAA